MATATKWIKLKHLPVSTCDRDLKQLNGNVFISTHYSQQPFDAIQNDDGYLHHLDIHKYDLTTDQWTTNSLPVNKAYQYSLKLTIDKETQCIYIYTTDGKLHTINSDTNTLKQILEGLPQYRNPWQMLFIDGKIILMAEKVKGFVIDTKNHMEITEISRSGNFELTNNYSPPLTSAYIRSGNYILNIVADPYDDNGFIHKYSLSDNKLIETDLRFPKNPYLIRTCSGYAMSKCQKYIIILGGWALRSYGLYDDIALFDIQRKVLIHCSLKCPFKGRMQAITMSSDERDKLLVSGYIRQLWKLPEFRNLKTFPGLIELIKDRVCIEYIHIIGRGAFRDSGRKILEHWKVNIDDILNSIIVD